MSSAERPSPTFSIVLPIYNSPVDHLRDQLEAISEQTYPHLECVVVDDGSPIRDGVEVARVAAGRDDRIHLYERPVNGGIAAATNDALDRATNEWIVFSDHDDLLERHALERIAAHLREHPLDDIVYTDERLIDGEGNVLADYRKPDLSPERFLAQNYFCHIVTVRRLVVEEIGGLDARYEPSTDREFNMRAVDAARSVGHIPEMLYRWRAIPGSVALDVEEKPQVAESVVLAADAWLARHGERAHAVNAPGHPASVRILREPVDAEVESIVFGSRTTAAELQARVSAATADYVLLAHRDMEPYGDDELDQLVALCARDGVAMVGPKLVSDDGRMLSGGRVHGPVLEDLLQGLEVRDNGPWGALDVNREVASVHPIGAVLDRRAVLDAGGFDLPALLGGLAPGTALPAELDPVSEQPAFVSIVLGTALWKRGMPTIWSPLATACVPHELQPDRLTRIAHTRLHAGLAASIPDLRADPYSPNGSFVPPPAPAETAPATSAMDRAKAIVIGRLGIDRVARTADVAQGGVTDLEHAVSFFESELLRQGRVLTRTRETLEALQHEAARDWISHRTRLAVAEGSLWGATAPLRAEPLISVVLPTRDRSGLVVGAVGSVIDQAYARWELIVVDDGSEDDTAAVLGTFRADDRIEVVRTDGVGASAARNVGLAAATGDFVAFLDDDNAMHPGWLRSIAEYTGRHPEAVALYGAQLREDFPDDFGEPSLVFRPDVGLDELRIDNCIDLGVLAVRRGHPEMHFDESLTRYIDWDLVVRLKAAGDLRPLPALAGTYTTRASQRISGPADPDGLEAMRRRFADAADAASAD